MRDASLEVQTTPPGSLQVLWTQGSRLMMALKHRPERLSKSHANSVRQHDTCGPGVSRRSSERLLAKILPAFNSSGRQASRVSITWGNGLGISVVAGQSDRTNALRGRKWADGVASRVQRKRNTRQIRTLSWR